MMQLIQKTYTNEAMQNLKKIVNEEIWPENATKCIIQNIKKNNYENCLLILPPKVSSKPDLVHCKEFIKIAEEFKLEILDKKENLDSQKATLEFNKIENIEFNKKFTNYLNTALEARYNQVEESAKKSNIKNYKTTNEMLYVLTLNNFKNINNILDKSNNINLIQKR